jgi:2-iminobutanoate/2-iminopropanoate deaminase
MKPAPAPVHVAVLALTLFAGCAVTVEGDEFTPDPAPASHLVDEGALGPYSAAVRAGELVFLSGKIGERGQGFEREAQSAIDAVEAGLERAGLSLADVVSATVYLTDMGRYAELNAIYAERLPAPYPARACVAVAALPAGAQVEIQVVARAR